MVQDGGCRVFQRWKRPAVYVPFLPVLLGVQDVGRGAVIAAELYPSRRSISRCMMTACADAAGLVYESPTILSRCMMMAWLCLRGVSHSLPSEAGIAVASCVVIEMFS